jgi:hypothetical protein
MSNNAQTPRKRWASVVALLALLFAVGICILAALKVRRVGQASALCDWAYRGNVEQVRRLLREGADPNELNALGYAKWGGNHEIIALLERAGAKDKAPWVACAPPKQ